MENLVGDFFFIGNVAAGQMSIMFMGHNIAGEDCESKIGDVEE